jgi:hypothetical protein
VFATCDEATIFEAQGVSRREVPDPPPIRLMLLPSELVREIEQGGFITM